jgi:hypothetical protein
LGTTLNNALVCALRSAKKAMQGSVVMNPCELEHAQKLSADINNMGITSKSGTCTRKATLNKDQLQSLLPNALDVTLKGYKGVQLGVIHPEG